MSPSAPAATWQSNPPEQLLKERFHIDTGFHPGQREIIEQLVMGKRLLVIQRTGWGKSLCYQMASLYYPHLTLVFSPLKALMRDQCQRCNDSYGIAAGIVSSEFSIEENRATLEQAKVGRLKILFIAPERLSNALWQSYVLQLSISMIVVDEAHCISIWGHDFRPDYQRIRNLLSLLPANIPVLAVTATANMRVEQDVLRQISGDVQVIRGSMLRPNLQLHVEHLHSDQEKLSYITVLMPLLPGTGIIYTMTKYSAEQVSAFLQQQGIQAEYYHADRAEDVKQDIERKLMANSYKVVCSTVALGMGIDIPDIRFVIHYQMPASPINYYQEIGRAGRDGKTSWCVLLYNADDRSIQENFMRMAQPEAQNYQTVLSLLRSHTRGLKEYDILYNTGLSQKFVQRILSNLEDQGLVRRDPRRNFYTPLSRQGEADISIYDQVRESKYKELRDMQLYAECRTCLMEHLTNYLGDDSHYSCRCCGNCRPSNFPQFKYPERTYKAAMISQEYLPAIEKRNGDRGTEHEAGWSLSYHSNTRIGNLVRASKYEGRGLFPREMVIRAVEVIRTRYPIKLIDGIVSVPPTKSGNLVETFARQIATELEVNYMLVVEKVRQTREQKSLSNRVQKIDNVKAAFRVSSSEQVEGRTFLLIDDIYDSGYMLREVGKTLMQAGAKAVYPFTITRTAHSDDQ